MPRRVVVITLATCVCLGLGVVGMLALMQARRPLQRQVSEVPGKLVRVLTVLPQDVSLPVQGFGTVRAKTERSVVPEVSGPLVRLSPRLRAGFHVKRGELLFEIDPRPYRLAVQRIKAQIVEWRKEIAVLRQQEQNHQSTLRLARKNLAIADQDLRRDEALVERGTISPRELDRRRQWRNDYLNAVQSATNSLALIGPQVEKAQAAIAVAQAQLADAELQLHKTRLLAPFDGQVVHSTLDPGEYVQAGREVAVLYDTAAVEIPIAVPLDDLRWLPILSPEVLRQAGSDPAAQASLPLATVTWQSGTRAYTWQGRVVRWEAGLDQQTRTLTLVVEVQAPWQAFQPGKHPPLQPGMFCQVEVAAMTVSGATLIPRLALRDHQTVFVVQDNKLARRQVRVLRLLREQAIITAGLQRGDRVVVSPLTAPIVGMKLRPVEAEPHIVSATSGRQRERDMVLVEKPVRRSEVR